MIDEMYDDVLSIMSKYGFTQWFSKNQNGRVSPLKWCYDVDGTLKTTKKPPKNIKWLVQSHDENHYYPIELSVDDDGVVGPR